MRNILSVIFLISIRPVLAQLSNPDAGVLAEEVFASPKDETAYSGQYDDYLQFTQHPLDLNTATKEQLRMLQLLTELQMENLLRRRAETGPLLSVYELQAIDGFDEPTIRRIRNLVVVSDARSVSWRGLTGRLFRPRQGHVLLRTEMVLNRVAGYRSRDGVHSIYVGPPMGRYLRIRGQSSGDYYYGIATESDAGERFRWDPGRRAFGPDFTSAFVSIRNKGRIRQLMLGDFRASFGQGLIFGGGFSVGKGAESVTTMRRAAAGFMPHTSVTEAGFFRGGAITLQLTGGLSVHAYISRAARDGAIRLSADSAGYLGSIAFSGYHRTRSEWARRKSWLESSAGTVLAWNSGSVEAGIIMQTRYMSLPIRPGQTLYNHFDPFGNADHHVGAYVNFRAGRAAFFSEGALSYAGIRGHAWIAGVLVAPAAQVDLALVARSYSPGYHAPYASPLSENTSPENEDGFYIGWKYKPGRKFLASGFIDYFRFPMLRFRCYQPSMGTELLVRQAYYLNRKTFFQIQYRREDKIRNITAADARDFATQPVVRENITLQAEHAISPSVTARFRLQSVSFRDNISTQYGYFMCTDLMAKAGGLRLALRYGLFNADGADTKIYAAERDVWSVFAYTSLSGVGVRACAVAEYAFTSRIDGWVRLALTRYDDRESTGYGTERSEGPLRTELKVQLRYAW